MTYTFPRRRTILHFAQRFFTLGCTFTSALLQPTPAAKNQPETKRKVYDRYQKRSSLSTPFPLNLGKYFSTTIDHGYGVLEVPRE